MKSSPNAIPVDSYAQQGEAVLAEWEVASETAQKILESWILRAEDWNRKNIPTDDIDTDILLDQLVDLHRYDPVKLVNTIAAHPQLSQTLPKAPFEIFHELAPPVRFEIARSHRIESQTATFFKDLAKRLERKNLPGNRDKKKILHPDWAVWNWFGSPQHFSQRVPPHCLLDNASLALAVGLSKQMKSSAVRTAISNWKLVRPSVKNRLPIPAESKAFLESGLTYLEYLPIWALPSSEREDDDLLES